MTQRVERLHLPSGVLAIFDASGPGQLEGLFARDAAAFAGRLTDATGAAVSLRNLPLSDFHTLRALLRKLGKLPESDVKISCQNCKRRFSVKPCQTLELGPYRDGELDDPELDAPFDFDAVHRLPVSEVADVRLSPRTLAEAEPLHVALAKPGALTLKGAIVTAMGIAELDGETDPRRIGRRLMRVSAEAFDELLNVFEAAHYPARLTTRHLCPRCGAVAWVDAPAAREFGLDPAEGGSVEIRREAPPAEGPFMSRTEFEDLVGERADLAYSDLAVTNVDLVVVDGPAECDDGGEPLLGCYRPADPDALPPQPPEIRLFYRTFVNVWNDEGRYDVGAEVEETLRHELEHHLAHLAGTDPVDEQERAEIEAEVARRIGRTEAKRRAISAAGRDLRGFFANTWALWALLLAATVIAFFVRR
jgi:hypothetical protein